MRAITGLFDPKRFIDMNCNTLSRFMDSGYANPTKRSRLDDVPPHSLCPGRAPAPLRENSVVARTERTDVVLVGGGIMSATLGVFLKELEPSWNIILLERLDKVAQESSNPWNNAGTGHSALCELNYAPAGPDGTVSAAKR